MLSLEKQNALREKYRKTNPGWRPATEQFANLVRSRISKESRLLDLGCGRGGLVEQLDHPLKKIVAVDPDLASLIEHRLAHSIPPLSRSVAISHRLPFLSNSYDLVYCSWVLEHLIQPGTDFKEIGRILRPGGNFVFITPNKRHPVASINRFSSGFSNLQKRMVNYLYNRSPDDTFPAYYRANTPDDLNQLAKIGDMELVELITVADPTYLAFTNSLFQIASWFENRLAPDRKVHLVGVMQAN